MKKVFFTGHRDSTVYVEDMRKLARLLRKFAAEGTVDFYAGGANCQKQIINITIL